MKNPLAWTPLDLGDHLIENNSTDEVNILSTTLIDNVHKKVSFKIVEKSELQAWIKGYFFTIAYEGIETVKKPELIQESFVNTPEVRTMLQDLPTLRIEAVQSDGARTDILIHYYFENIDAESEVNFFQLIDMFSSLDDAVLDVIA